MSTEKLELKLSLDLGSALSAVGQMKTNWSRAVGQMKTDVRGLGREAKGAFSQLEGRSQKLSRSVSSVGSAGTSAGKALQSGFMSGALGAGLLAGAIHQVGQGLRSLVAEAQQLSSVFEEKLGEVSTLLDSHLMPQMGAFAQRLVDISVQGDQTLKTLTTALYQTISAGVEGFKLQTDVVREADIAATAGVTRTGKAINAFVRVLNAWKSEAGSVKEINDLLFTTVKKGLTTFPKMASAIGNVAGTAAQAGLSLKETLAAFAATTRVTKNSATAMTYLRNLIVNILKPSRQAKQAFEELGISYGQTALQSKGLIGIMEEIKKKTGGAAEQIANLFPNQRAMQAAMTLAGRGLENFRDSLDAMNKSAGASRAAFEKMKQTWTFQLRQLKNIISSQLLKLYGPMFERLKGFLQSFTSWFHENREVIEAWTRGIGETIGFVADLIGGLVKALWTLTAPIRWLMANNPFVWLFKYANEYDRLFAQRQKDVAELAHQTRKLNAATRQYALVQQQIISGGVELNAAMEKLARKLRKLNSEQRASIQLAITQRMTVLQRVIALEQRRNELYQQGKVRQIEGIAHTLAALKKQHNLTGVSLGLLRKEEKAGKRILEMLKKKSERLTETGLAGIAATRFIARGYSEERRLEMRRQKDIKKIDSLRLKDKTKYYQALAAINAYWDRRLAELRAKREKQATRTEKREAREPRLARAVREYQQSVKAVAALSRQQGDAFERLQTRYQQLLAKHGQHAQLKLQIDRWYQDQRRKLEKQEEKKLDQVVERTLQKRHEAARRALRLEQQEGQAKQRLAQMRRQIQGVKGPLPQASLIQADAQQQIQRVEAQLKRLKQQAQEIWDKMRIGAIQADVGQKQIASLNRIIDLRRQEIDLIKQGAKAQIDGLSVASRLHRKFAEDASQTQAKFADTLYGMSQDLVGGIGNIISSTFQGIVAGEKNVLQNAGKMFLDVLAGMAARLGAFFMTSGAAQQFVPPYTGAGAIAGGVALMGLSGALKGASSLVGGSFSAPSVSRSAGSYSAPSTPSAPERTSLPGQRGTQRDARPVQFLFAMDSLPWDGRTSADHYRGFKRWAGEASRATGLENPFEFARAAGARRMR